jgi:hypothetical protein
MKKCYTCKEEKKDDEFYFCKLTKDKLESNCKTCRKKYITDYQKNNPYRRKYHSRNINLKKMFGISIDEYDKKFQEQGRKCAICGKLWLDNKKKLSVDHDHKTKSIRGLLCNRCNLAIGSVDESTELLSKMIEYLKNYKGK